MEQSRPLRFLIPPFFFFASMLWGAILDPSRNLLQYFDSAVSNNLGTIAQLISAVGIATIPLGFLLESISSSLIRFGFDLSGQRRRHYQAFLSDACLEELKTRLGIEGEVENSLYPAAAFVHGWLRSVSQGTFQWLTRRWSAFNVAMSSIVALVLAHAATLLLARARGGPWRAGQSISWLCTTLTLVAVLLYIGYKHWDENRKMIEFLSLMPATNGSPKVLGEPTITLEKKKATLIAERGLFIQCRQRP